MTSNFATVSVILALYVPFCAPVPDPVVTSGIELSGLWTPPRDLGSRDLYYGSWGQEHAPDPFAVYTLVEHKHTGTNPGMTVVDERGRQWSVKQAPKTGEPPEGPIEVVVSRVLDAIGYHQPPVYFMPSFLYRDDWGTHVEGGGRFRLKHKSLKDRGEWSWQRNPFVGTQPYQGLLVTLLLFNSSDLKNANNTLYEYRIGDLAEPWYVVRDLGTALGRTGRWAPRRGNPALFAASPFITGTQEGMVEFGYRGYHQELLRDRISVADVRWAARLLSGLSERQWRDAFLAGGFSPAAAQPFLTAIQSRLAQAASVGDASVAPAERSR
jgi:hypothetical protein